MKDNQESTTKKKKHQIVSSWLDLMGDSGESEDEDAEEIAKKLEEEKDVGSFKFFPNRNEEKNDIILNNKEEVSE